MRGYYPVLRRFVTHIATLVLIILFAGTSLTLAYMRHVDASILSLHESTQANLLRASTVKIDSFEKKNAEIEADLQVKEALLSQKDSQLATKSHELDQKKADLDKASSDLTAKVKELSSAKAQLSANASELSRLRSRPPLFVFKVDSSSIANVDQKKEDIKQLVTNAFDVISDIYSQPYLLHSVTIDFVDSFSNQNAGAEIVISNGTDGLALTIKLKDFNKNDFNDTNSVIHEIIHSFHGLAVLESTAYEEGITVAAADAVMEKLIADGKIPAFNPLYIRISSNTYNTSPLTLPGDSSAFYTSSDAANYYQIAGYGWFQLYKADHNFFKKFNETIYDQKRQGKDLSDSVVIDAVKSSFTGSVQGKSTDEWLQTKAFKTT